VEKYFDAFTLVTIAPSRSIVVVRPGGGNLHIGVSTQSKDNRNEEFPQINPGGSGVNPVVNLTNVKVVQEKALGRGSLSPAVRNSWYSVTSD